MVAVNSGTSWRVEVSVDGDVRFLRAGEYRSELSLAPGERADLPDVITIFYQGGADGAVQALRTYLKTASAPPPTGWRSGPPTVFNTWFGYGPTVSDRGRPDGALRQAARTAAEAGVEVFVVDAGWYRGNPSFDWLESDDSDSSAPPVRDDFNRGLGTWVENPDKWLASPGAGGSNSAGLRNFSDYVHSLDVLHADGSVLGKMRFGLWTEPERFDPDYAGSERLPDAWAIPGTPILDLSRFDVVDAIGGRIQAAIDAYGVDYLKIDSNHRLLAGQDGAPTGHVWSDWSAGFERLLDHLRRSNPNLFIEHCAGGLKRYWIGLCSVAHSSWLDDDVDAENVRHLLDVTDGLLLPRQKTVLVTEQLTGDDDPNQIADLIKRYSGGDAHNGGTIGFSCQLDTWSPAQARASAVALDKWRRSRR
jgi:alpha-galactosidase